MGLWSWIIGAPDHLAAIVELAQIPNPAPTRFAATRSLDEPQRAGLRAGNGR